MIFQTVKAIGKRLQRSVPWAIDPITRSFFRSRIERMRASGEFLLDPPSVTVTDDYERPASDAEKIPKIFHQMWTHPPLPTKFERFVASVKKYHKAPEWEYRLWDIDQMNTLVREHFSQYEEAYHALPTLIHQCDTFRHMMLAVHGGLYMDLDYLFYRELDSVIEDCKLCLTSEDDRTDSINHLSCFFVAGVPDHAFFHDAIAAVLDRPLDEIRAYDNPLVNTGPQLSTRVWRAGAEQYRAKCLRRILLSIPAEYHFGRLTPPERAIGVHVCSGTWR